jgi:hypothetical protein
MKRSPNWLNFFFLFFFFSFLLMGVKGRQATLDWWPGNYSTYKSKRRKDPNL